MKEFTTLKMRVPTFTDAGKYCMNAVLVDCQGNKQLLVVTFGAVIKINEYFAPCQKCGVAILMTHWYENENEGGDGCCARCGLLALESKPTTRVEAELFLKNCLNFFGGGFHPDNGGEEYLNDDGRVFTDSEARVFNDNMDAAFKFFTDDIYKWCMNYMDSENS
jgi:hypothetical protein